MVENPTTAVIVEAQPKIVPFYGIGTENGTILIVTQRKNFYVQSLNQKKIQTSIIRGVRTASRNLCIRMEVSIVGFLMTKLKVLIKQGQTAQGKLTELS